MRFKWFETVWVFVVCAEAAAMFWSFCGATSGAMSRYASILSLNYSCEDASKLAISDFHNGAYYLFNSGLSETSTAALNQALFKDYHIEQINPSCISLESVTCYTDTMRALLSERLGGDFYGTARDKADVLENK